MISPLQIRLARAQNDAKAARRLLRRARLLYIRFVWMAVVTDPTDASMNRAVQRMIQSGMYANAAPRDVRFAILKRAWTLDTGKTRWMPFEKDNWHEWYQRNGFAGHSWVRAQKRGAA